jgi:hypothetical protein
MLCVYSSVRDPFCATSPMGTGDYAHQHNDTIDDWYPCRIGMRSLKELVFASVKVVTRYHRCYYRMRGGRGRCYPGYRSKWVRKNHRCYARRDLDPVNINSLPVPFILAPSPVASDAHDSKSMHMSELSQVTVGKGVKVILVRVYCLCDTTISHPSTIAHIQYMQSLSDDKE